MSVELTDGITVLLEQDRGNGRFRVRRGDKSFNISIEEMVRVIQATPLGFWEECTARLSQKALPCHLDALVAAAKIDGKARPLFTWGSVDAIPYLFQYTPLFALRRSPWGRVLVADETGLGKTIEAGITMMELLEADPSDGGIRDVLIVAPINLLDEWAAKLLRHFGLIVKQINAADLAERLHSHRLPSKDGQIHFLSMDALPSLMRQTTYTAATVPPERLYDLMVVDEAHHFKNEERKRCRGLKLLLGDPFPKAEEEALRPIPKLLLLTATPLSTHLDNLQTYFTFMDPGLSQVGGRDVRKEAFLQEHRRVVMARRVANLAVQLLARPSDTALITRIQRALASSALRPDLAGHGVDDELSQAVEHLRTFLADPGLADPATLAEALLSLDPWADQIVRNTRRGVGMGGEVEVHVRNLAVALHPAEDKLVRTAPWRLHDHPFGQLAIRQQMSSSLPAYLFRHLLGLSEVDIAAELLLDMDPEDPRPDLAKEERVRLEILRKVHDAPADSGALLQVPDAKFQKFSQALKSFLIDHAQRGALVFTRFTATAEYLQRRLKAGAADLGDLTVFHIHGGIKPKDRRSIIRQAQDCPGKFVMVLTEVGQEGVDLQFATGVFHYDLPWNPMRIIQRNGRVHRIGQKAKDVYFYTFFVNGTLDHDISAAIAERMEMVYTTFGDLPEGLVGLEPGAELRRLIGDGVNLEVYTGLHGINSSQDLESRIREDGAALRAQTLQIELHHDKIRKVISEDADSCQAWFPLLREALFGSLGSMERVLKHDLAALLTWADREPRTGLHAVPLGADLEHWEVTFGSYHLALQPSARLAQPWRRMEQENGFTAHLMPDEGGRRVEAETASILHMDHPFIRDLAKRALQRMDPPMAMASSPDLTSPHCLLGVAFTVEEAGRSRSEARWFLLQSVEGSWRPCPTRASEQALRAVFANLGPWQPLQPGPAARLAPGLLDAIHDLQDIIERDVLLARQAQTVRMVQRSVRLWVPVVAYWGNRLHDARSNWQWLQHRAAQDPEGLLSEQGVLPEADETPEQAAQKLVLKAQRALPVFQRYLNQARERVTSGRARVAQARAETPAGIRVIVQDHRPNALVLIYPSKDLPQ